MKVIVTLAAYNEIKNINWVLSGIIERGYTCILVDDGSSDGTAEAARKMGARVIRHIRNLGQGWGVLTGFKAALREDCDVIVEMDADGQHDPGEIELLVKKLEESQADIVVGSRVLGQNYPNAPFFRKKFLPFFTGIINFLTGYRMTDSMCGFRAFTKSALERAQPVLDDMLEPQYLAAEMFIRFSALGLKVDEVPIHLRDRTSGVSYKGFIRYGWGVLKAILVALSDSSFRKKRL